MTQPTNHPMEWESIMNALPEGHLFTPSGIVMFAADGGLLPAIDQIRLKSMKFRMRLMLDRLSRKNDFPSEGDGMVDMGNIPAPGWFTWRWVEALKGNAKNRGDSKKKD
ncbi:MAG: hypothetical protein QNK37_13130 [Acidobacteriota bacterium]|nr:hypothetical protein [Acidobacteriota bacterium]